MNKDYLLKLKDHMMNQYNYVPGIFDSTYTVFIFADKNYESTTKKFFEKLLINYLYIKTRCNSVNITIIIDCNKFNDESLTTEMKDFLNEELFDENIVYLDYENNHEKYSKIKSMVEVKTNEIICFNYNVLPSVNDDFNFIEHINEYSDEELYNMTDMIISSSLTKDVYLIENSENIFENIMKKFGENFVENIDQYYDNIIYDNNENKNLLFHIKNDYLVEILDSISQDDYDESSCAINIILSKSLFDHVLNNRNIIMNKKNSKKIQI